MSHPNEKKKAAANIIKETKNKLEQIEEAKKELNLRFIDNMIGVKEKQLEALKVAHNDIVASIKKEMMIAKTGLDFLDP